MENQPTPTIRPTPRFRFPQPQAPPPPRPQPQQPPPQFQPRLPIRPTPRLPLQQLLRPTAVAPPQPQPQPQPQAPAAAPSRPPPQQPQPPAPAPRQPQQQPPRPDVAPPPQIQQVQTAPSSTDAPTLLEIEPIKKPPPPPSTTPKAASREPTPPQSPKTITTSLWPMQSPRTKPSPPPPPPPPSLPLPPSQLKPEPEPELSKTMLFQDVKMSESMPRAAPATQKSEFSSNTNSRHSVADVEVPMRVITLAGENKGAWMEFGSPSSLLKNKNKPETIGTARQQQVEEDGAQGNGKKIEKKNGKGANSTKAPPVPSAFVNSNVQSVNNSIVLHASCTHGDPGVHLVFSRKPAPANGYHRKDHPNGHQT